MKLVTAIFKPSRLDAVIDALSEVGATGLTVSEVRGYGRQLGKTEVYRGAEYEVRLLPKVKVEVACADDAADRFADCHHPGGQYRDHRRRKDLHSRSGICHPHPHRRTRRTGRFRLGQTPQDGFPSTSASRALTSAAVTSSAVMQLQVQQDRPSRPAAAARHQPDHARRTASTTKARILKRRPAAGSSAAGTGRAPVRISTPKPTKKAGPSAVSALTSSPAPHTGQAVLQLQIAREQLALAAIDRIAGCRPDRMGDGLRHGRSPCCKAHVSPRVRHRAVPNRRWTSMRQIARMPAVDKPGSPLTLGGARLPTRAGCNSQMTGTRVPQNAQTPSFPRIAIVGAGLIGASIAPAAQAEYGAAGAVSASMMPATMSAARAAGLGLGDVADTLADCGEAEADCVLALRAGWRALAPLSPPRPCRT